MTPNKKREFWIKEWTDSQPDGFLSGNVSHEISHDVFMHPVSGAIHLIDYNTYTELLTLAKEMREALDDLIHGSFDNEVYRGQAREALTKAAAVLGDEE